MTAAQGRVSLSIWRRPPDLVPDQAFRVYHICPGGISRGQPGLHLPLHLALASEGSVLPARLGQCSVAVSIVDGVREASI